MGKLVSLIGVGSGSMAAARAILAGCVVALVLSGCLGPTVLDQQVLSYDEVTRKLDEKLLLLNIARVDTDESIHFTSTSTIAATFDWTTTVGASGQLEQSPGFNFLNLNIGSSSSENPTFQIIPVSGEQFTKRILTPFKDTAFEFLIFQGANIAQVMRLMAAGIEIQAADGKFLRFIENRPRRPTEYDEFRRIALHLEWLSDHRQLFARSLVFEETLVADSAAVPRAEDITNGLNLGLRWRQKPDGHYELTRLTVGRVVVTNVDPMELTDAQRFELNEKVRRNPSDFVYVDIRPEGPGGELAFQGALKLRSLYQILTFVARGMAKEPEHDVTPDPRTGEIGLNPRSALQINVTDSAPDKRSPFIGFRGQYYCVNDTHWDRFSFTLLNVLFQTSVGVVEGVGIPITIAK